MFKKFKSRWFVVATEGATTDGRNIARVWIEQMAESYNPKTYGARINLDHIKTWLYRKDEPHAQAYGDVLALKTQENEEGKLQLLAQIDPTDDLIALNNKRQKVYTSIEVDTNFGETGKAYLVGLAVTDNPASLGTEMLQFAATAQANPFNARKLKADNLFTEAVETILEFNEVEPEKPSLFERIAAMFGQRERTEQQRFADVDNAVMLLSEEVQNISQKYTALETENQTLKQRLDEYSAKITEHSEKFAELEKQPAENYRKRPLANGDSVNDGRFF
ncbi:capsid scaffolding protein [Canicola haemoglobinophilus]|uniref:Phage capsid scaffolding n=1 Tax=Canicola haemoglobinophilus TaxID=733 RepID=A0A1V4B173_9PAST|nr:GPO family capsid scaffolding protein [Canicola haemoglobinophilus]OOS00660.1 capsid scaffolding protein [Canicola haemoglobinophilus]STO54349.1 phage capsid scaffolding [Canicola haemoglobinophilus]STO60182.1 phage capsid scaffolding [Canicola haemoglobinophilus]STO68883.1 phage capsid scaffolding [Canicola haemoglobinophilus]